MVRGRVCVRDCSTQMSAFCRGISPCELTAVFEQCALSRDSLSKAGSGLCAFQRQRRSLSRRSGHNMHVGQRKGRHTGKQLCPTQRLCCHKRKSGKSNFVYPVTPHRLASTPALEQSRLFVCLFRALCLSPGQLPHYRTSASCSVRSLTVPLSV